MVGRWKRTLTLVLAVVLLFTILPVKALAANKTYTLTLTDERGNPIEDATVKLTASGRNYTLGHQGNGVYSSSIYYSSSRSTTYTLTVTCDGYESYTTSVTVGGRNYSSDSYFRKTVALKATARYTLTVNVINADTTAPVEGATVTVDGDEITEAGNGAYTVSIGNGTVDIAVSAEGYMAATGEASVNGADAQVTIALTPLYSVTIHVIDKQTGQPVTNATVKVEGDAATRVGDVYTYETVAGDYDVLAVANGYENGTYRLVVHHTDMEITIYLNQADPDAEYVIFDMFYLASGEFPDVYHGSGDPIYYGPSGNDEPLVQVQVDIAALQSDKYSDVVVFSRSSNGTYYFEPNYDSGVEDAEAELAAAKAFWAAVVECMTEDSIAAFKDTGLFQDFVGYCMKNQSSGGDYHGDGILNVEPPVYVIELYMGERYMGGSVTDQYMEAKTMADVLEMLEGYLGVNVTWEEDGNGIAVPDSDGNYNGTFVRDHIIYSVLVTQREKQLATEQLKDIQYIKRSNIYYQALFDISMTGVAMPVDYIVTYKDGVGGSVFYDHEYGAYAGETVPAFEGDPVWGEYIFRGWDLNVDGTDAVYSSEDLAAMIVEEDMVFTAVYEPIITFHANNDAYTGSDIFRVFYPTGTQVSDASFEWHMTAEKKIEAFYDIPEFAYSVHNGYIFKGWYLDKDNENDSRPISWDTVYTTSTDVYAHWITVGTVAKEEDYKILADGASSYSEFDLIGVQIRTLENDPGGYYGTPGSGLRFLCVLSENVYGQINALHTNNASGADYGFVTAKTSTAQKYAAEAGNPTDYYLQYKGSNVNGIDTSTAFKYVKNSLCSGAGITDHYDGEAYRIYTVVITYANKTGDALAEAQAVEFLARAYLKYYDANGLERVHYHNYTGNSVYGGCSASYTWVASVLGSGGEVG